MAADNIARRHFFIILRMRIGLGSLIGGPDTVLRTVAVPVTATLRARIITTIS